MPGSVFTPVASVASASRIGVGTLRRPMSERFI